MFYTIPLYKFTYHNLFIHAHLLGFHSNSRFSILSHWSVHFFSLFSFCISFWILSITFLLWFVICYYSLLIYFLSLQVWFGSFLDLHMFPLQMHTFLYLLEYLKYMYNWNVSSTFGELEHTTLFGIYLGVELLGY